MDAEDPAPTRTRNLPQPLHHQRIDLRGTSREFDLPQGQISEVANNRVNQGR